MPHGLPGGPTGWHGQNGVPQIQGTERRPLSEDERSGDTQPATDATQNDATDNGATQNGVTDEAATDAATDAAEDKRGAAADDRQADDAGWRDGEPVGEIRWQPAPAGGQRGTGSQRGAGTPRAGALGSNGRKVPAGQGRAAVGGAAAGSAAEANAGNPSQQQGAKDADTSAEDESEAGIWAREAAARFEQFSVGRARSSQPVQPAGFGMPVKVDEIAVAARALSDDLAATTKELSTSVESQQFRRELDVAAETIRALAGELESTAGNLIRLAAAEEQRCSVVWGICPEHGLTLMNAGETVTCHVLGCYQQYAGPIERCTQPVAYKVVDVAGPALLTCSGHAIACRLHLDGAVITLASDSLEVL
ncbi:hypothetical protein [Kribbella amoyensis]|uniref:hypothetical protein n=1 Tax=Kribbella amoyensis TaxID=996641 RepID=UPI0011A60604|nr:hypothetical protein [Kribbella amoyensis]